jgi:peptidyl-prolyl cis-trans isomerase B (cyclophilin B)
MKKSVFLLILFLAACGGATPVETADPDDSSANQGNLETEVDPDMEEIEYNMELPYSLYFKATNPLVTMNVAGKGTIEIELFPDVAPNSVNNMIKLIQDGFYDGLIFHRVIQGFMIQGGWGDLKGKQATCTIAGEFSANGFDNALIHERGVISMARTNVRNSATSQFFLMHAKSPWLDGEYAAFGGMVSGFDVLDAVATTPTGFQDAPNTEVVIESVTVDLRGYTPAPPVCVN